MAHRQAHKSETLHRDIEATSERYLARMDPQPARGKALIQLQWLTDLAQRQRLNLLAQQSCAGPLFEKINEAGSRWVLVISCLTAPSDLAVNELIDNQTYGAR